MCEPALKVGSAGEHAYAKSGDESGTVTVRLLQTSMANDILSALIDVEGELLMKDMGGATLVSSTSARLKKPPKGAFGKDIGNREYVFICPRMFAFTGGSAS